MRYAVISNTAVLLDISLIDDLEKTLLPPNVERLARPADKCIRLTAHKYSGYLWSPVNSSFFLFILSHSACKLSSQNDTQRIKTAGRMTDLASACHSLTGAGGTAVPAGRGGAVTPQPTLTSRAGTSVLRQPR